MLFRSGFNLQAANEIYSRLLDCLWRIVPFIELEYGRFGELGIDLALDENGAIWFFECNSKPGKDTVVLAGNQEEVDLAFARPLQYAKFLTGFYRSVAQLNRGEFRARELADRIIAYQEYKEAHPARAHKISQRQRRIQRLLGATTQDWNDWRWQMQNRLSTAEELSSILGVSSQASKAADLVGREFRFAISPYYAALIDPNKADCPIGNMVVPRMDELQDTYGVLDPMSEEQTTPAPCITQRYPDRLILNVTNVCPSFCRFCQRRRNISSGDTHQPLEAIMQGVAYIKKTTTIRDVLITGGDPLTFADAMLETVISAVRAIPHVEIIRIGSRVLATLPQRITPELCQMFKKYHPLMISTHFNHPLEVTPEAVQAAAMLADAGVLLNNQSVLLKGVNDNPYTFKLLCQLLLGARIRPYYLFHPKDVKGTSHFACTIDEGLKIMAELRGTTSGLAIPTYVFNAPGGLGKIPLSPNYFVSHDAKGVTLLTWEGRLVRYENKP